jgi:hypothetical protein
MTTRIGFGCWALLASVGTVRPTSSVLGLACVDRR